MNASLRVPLELTSDLQVIGVISGRDLIQSRVTALHFSQAWTAHTDCRYGLINYPRSPREPYTSASAEYRSLYPKPFIMTFSILLPPAYPKPRTLSPNLACCGPYFVEELALDRWYGPQDNHNLPADCQIAVLRGHNKHTRVYTTYCYSNADGTRNVREQQRSIQARMSRFPYPCYLDAERNCFVE